MEQQYQAATALKQRLESLPRNITQIDTTQARRVAQTIDTTFERLVRELPVVPQNLPTLQEQGMTAHQMQMDQLPRQSQEHLAQLLELVSHPEDYVTSRNAQQINQVFQQADQTVQQQLSQIGIMGTDQPQRRSDR